MRLKITNLRIKNFRNINELEINFKDDVNEIIAENGKGKTNTLSAITWCLFGKNIYDNKLFPISPIIDNEEKNDITTNVTLVINGDYVISRTYYQRKTTLQTGYIIDGVENLVNVTQSQYNEELKEKFIDEETFKSLSNINYIPNLNWKDLKKFIFDLIGDVKDEDILLRGDFDLIEEQIKSFGLDKTREMLNNSDKTLNEDIKKLEIEYQTKLNIKEKFVADSEEMEKLKVSKEEIQKELQEYEQRKAIRDKMNTIEFNKHAIEDYKKSYELNATSIDSIRSKEVDYIQNKINSVSTRLRELDIQTSQYEKELEEKKAMGKEIQEKKVKVENDTCSACGQKLSEEKIQSTLEKLKQQQLEELKKIQTQVDNLKNIIGANSSEYEQKTSELEELTNQLEEVKKKEYQVEENDKQKEIKQAIADKELENKKLEEEISSSKIEVSKLDNELLINNSNLLDELDEINGKLATTTTLDKLEDDLAITEKSLNEKRLSKTSVNSKINQAIQFSNLKAEIVREKAKSNFKIVDFKTKEFTQDGVEQETFKIYIDGIDYKELNTGMKILVAIDLLSGIQKLKDMYCPIIIDNAENLTSDIQVENTQLIIARAEKGIFKLEVS